MCNSFIDKGLEAQMSQVRHSFTLPSCYNLLQNKELQQKHKMSHMRHFTVSSFCTRTYSNLACLCCYAVIIYITTVLPYALISVILIVLMLLSLQANKLVTILYKI